MYELIARIAPYAKAVAAVAGAVVITANAAVDGKVTDTEVTAIAAAWATAYAVWRTPNTPRVL